MLTSAKNSLIATNTSLIPFNNAVNAREIAFAPLSKLVTRIFAALDATDASRQVVADAKTITRKLQGKRVSDKITPVAANPETPVNETQKSISASQMSFDSRIENFGKLITLLTSEPLYVPNETDVKIVTLNTLLTSLKTTNTAVITTTTPASNARISRNKILYLPITGLYDIQLEVKKYVKSVFGARSPEFKQISGIKFTKAR